MCYGLRVSSADTSNIVISTIDPFSVYNIMDVLNSALEQGLTPAIIVVIYLLIIKFIDAKRDSVQGKLNSELVESITNISKFITTVTETTISKDKDKCKNCVYSTFGSSQFILSKFVVNTLIINHIDVNKEGIIKSINNIANAEYYSIYADLNLYEINGTKVSERMNVTWIKEITDLLIDVIFKDGLDNEEKINAFNTRIDIKFQQYISYIINKALK